MWETLQQWQQAIGAAIGFVALAAAALFNAHLNRKRDNRLHGFDRALLARSLRAEAKAIIAQLQVLKRFSDETKVANPLEAAHKLQSMVMPIGTVFSEAATKIGLLDAEAAQALTHFYGTLAALRKKVDVPMPELEPTAGGDGLYSISGGELVASALYRAERMLPNVIDLGMLAIAALDGVTEKRHPKQGRARRENRSREHGF